MEFEEVIKPTLVEPGVKYFLNQTLKQCRHYKNNFNNILFNILLLCVFLVILGSLLIYKYKGKLEQKYIGEYKNGYIHGKGKMINYFEKWTKQGRFVKGGFRGKN